LIWLIANIFLVLALKSPIFNREKAVFSSQKDCILVPRFQPQEKRRKGTDFHLINITHVAGNVSLDSGSQLVDGKKANRA